MRHVVEGIILGLLAAAFAAPVWACTARDVLDRARTQRDQSKAARDVAEEFIDEEGFVKDVWTLDAGTGTLVMTFGVDADYRARLDEQIGGPSHGITKEGANVGAYEASVYGYDFKVKSTVREHMRLHVKEWSDAIRGNYVDALYRNSETGYWAPPTPTATKTYVPHRLSTSAIKYGWTLNRSGIEVPPPGHPARAGWTVGPDGDPIPPPDNSAASAPSPAPAARPTPSPSPAPVPTPAPVPVAPPLPPIDHAG